MLGALGVAAQPEQVLGHAARQVAARALRANRGPGGASSVTGLTGPSDSTQVSLLPPPRCIDTIGTSCVLETRVSPPGITAYESPAAATYVLNTTGRGSSRVLVPHRRRREGDVLLRDEVVRPRAKLCRERDSLARR